MACITLCFDFGNTRQKAAVFSDGEFKELVLLEHTGAAAIETLLDRYHPDKTILSSVIHHEPEVETLLTARSQFHLLSHRPEVALHSVHAD